MNWKRWNGRLSAALAAVFLCLSILFGVLLPRTKTVKTLGDGEAIIAQVEGADGSDYFLMTKDTMYRYDSTTGEEISTFSLNVIADMLKAEGKYDSLISGSLNQWSFKCIPDLEEIYYIAYDACGNIFRLKDDGKNLSLTDDYYLTKTHTVIKGCDNVNETLYMFAEINNLSYAQKVNITDLKGGILQSKMLWDLDVATPKAGCKKIIPATTDVLSVDVTEDALYLFRKGGSVVRMSLEFADSVDDDGKVNFFDSVMEYENGDQYQLAYDEAYRNCWMELIYEELEWLTEDEAAEYSDEMLNAASITVAAIVCVSFFILNYFFVFIIRFAFVLSCVCQWIAFAFLLLRGCFQGLSLSKIP